MKKIFVLLLLLLFAVQDIAAAKNWSAVEQARMAYICALADMAVYNTTMNKAVREEMQQFGWAFKDYKNTDRRADTIFYTVLHDGDAPNECNTLVVIPGTEKLKDIEVDLRFSKVVFGGTSPKEFREYAAIEKAAATQPMVHRGFNDYTMTAFFSPNQEQVMGAEYLRQFVDASNDHLFLTGHSLGGAVATLLAARLVASGADPEKISVFTFGAPTVGNTAFAEEYGYRLDLSRYTMSGDPVKNALQMFKSDYVHFGTEYKWQKNENSHRFNHSMAGYLDAAVRNYYDELLGKDLSLQQLAACKPEPLGDTQPAAPGSWYGEAAGRRLYIAPVYAELPEPISNDAGYMQAVAGDILMNRFQHIAVGRAAAAGTAVDTLFSACQAAEEAGCDTVAMLTISAEADKGVADLYRLAVDASFYDTAGVPLLKSMTSTTTKEITPIEAVMYDMARISEDISQAQVQGVLPE